MSIEPFGPFVVYVSYKTQVFESFNFFHLFPWPLETGSSEGHPKIIYLFLTSDFLLLLKASDADLSKRCGM